MGERLSSIIHFIKRLSCDVLIGFFFGCRENMPNQHAISKHSTRKATNAVASANQVNKPPQSILYYQYNQYFFIYVLYLFVWTNMALSKVCTDWNKALTCLGF